jgi:capsular exopolysaccharide synthesis family protein
VADFTLEFPDTSDFDLEFAQPSSDLLPTFEPAARVAPRTLGRVQTAMLSGRYQVSEELRMLFARVRTIGEQRPFRCLGLVSASSGEGKTTIALGLATAIARERGRKVLLIEADLRRPGVERQLGLPRAAGVAEWLERGSGPVGLRRVLPPGFDLLSGGHSTINAAELVGTQRMAYLLQAARLSFDYVIVDCPPLLPVIDSVLLQDLLDGFLFVVRASHTPRESILRAVNRVKPGRIQGLILNHERELIGSYYNYGNYGGAGGRYGESA